MRGHDIDLVSTSLFQDLCSSNEALHVVNDVILQVGAGSATLSPAEKDLSLLSSHTDQPVRNHG